MLKRDQYGIVCQHSVTDPSYCDGGDSCARTGILAAAGSNLDKNNLGLFIQLKTNELVRHPTQADWNDPRNTSRDNLVQWAVGQSVVQKDVLLQYAGKWFINKDFLDPLVRLYLYKCAKAKAPIHLVLLGYSLLALGMLWNCFIKPTDEQNQFSCICYVMGPLWSKLHLKWHPGLYTNLKEYWCGWRDQPEILGAMVKLTGIT